MAHFLESKLHKYILRGKKYQMHLFYIEHSGGQNKMDTHIRIILIETKPKLQVIFLKSYYKSLL